MPRTPGAKNKASQELRLVVAKLVDDNSEKFQAWIDAIEKDEGPLEAFKRIEALLEFCIPKLARSEITGANGGAIEMKGTLTHKTDEDILARFKQQITGASNVETGRTEPENG